MMQALIPVGWDTKGLPFNRRKRRSLMRSSGMLLHLFSGQQKWSLPKGELWEIDLITGADLLSPDLYAFILELGCRGSLEAVVGGPPCRTTSRLRAEDGGPPPLRSREHRFGLPGLTLQDALKVHTDNVLWFRMLIVYAVAVAGRYVCQQVVAEKDKSPRDQPASALECEKGVMFVLEHPEDPHNYLGPVDDASGPPVGNDGDCCV